MSTGPRTITPDAWTPQPWKNGRGITYEILRDPPAATGGATTAAAIAATTTATDAAATATATDVAAAATATDAAATATATAATTAATGPGAATDAYDLRISVGLVAHSGPFSTFPGYRRYSFLLGPAPITLVHASATALVAPGDHLSLPGDVPLEASVREATRLLNILVRAEHIASGAIVVGYGPTPRPVRLVVDLASTITTVYPDATHVDATGCAWVA